MAKKPNKAKGKPRVFSGLRTFDWRGPMRYLKPPRYLEIIGKASPNTITVANLEQFCEEKTGIDRNRTKTGVSSLQYFEKLVTLKHKMPDKTINKLKEGMERKKLVEIVLKERGESIPPAYSPTKNGDSE